MAANGPGRAQASASSGGRRSIHNVQVSVSMMTEVMWVDLWLINQGMVGRFWFHGHLKGARTPFTMMLKDD